ncbi:hypothetical protein BASA50_004952 [Batrachochytrium salamandrivorans]|uniref:DUF423 domain-containing protein n=1 Tax=Batrachochytrium salamandrivorans TaxID=1357716 RepID=A0ABQ8FE15_9FUNG|nr:hypothetical protein BASA60_005978 [Batrachochytrium salamandrivorans]KAH6574223.1 hypothetical protein BASA62_002542 [Batrachochytrium salamandrivorans]KAH6590086.1 hypothetical protein BASA61_005379 [Batrachochytrium salamandrivorans]KAH6596621.1 hypothetical protein BASA50_004952 [Batrachochytrium salamandrivorans]KAH9249585.1 hypothetical protein BASA81_012659 [Batrachochytrium salamandrivorans]
MSALFWRAGGLLGATGVICGAFGSHGLKKMLAKEPEAQRLTDSWQTASHYQIGHAIVLLATSARMHQVPTASSLAGWLLIAGTIGFSFSIYCLVLDRKKQFSHIMGPITPLGGMCLIAGWTALALM